MWQVGSSSTALIATKTTTTTTTRFANTTTNIDTTDTDNQDMTSLSSLTPPPPKTGPHLLVSLASAHVLHLQLNRPQQYNSMTDSLEADMRAVLKWAEECEAVWIVLVSGKGKAFCAGQDLKEWLGKQKDNISASKSSSSSSKVPLQPGSEVRNLQTRITSLGGFGGLSTSFSSKPLILAIDGLALGGGCEMVLNADLVIASSRSKFGLPEALRGVVAAQGGIPRLMAIVGWKRAAEMLFTGSTYDAATMQQWGLINTVVPIDDDASTSPEAGLDAVLKVAIAWAEKINQASPDAVRVTKRAMRQTTSPQGNWIDQATVANVATNQSRALYVGDNFKEGLAAFKEKRKPKWTDPPTFGPGAAARAKL